MSFLSGVRHVNETIFRDVYDRRRIFPRHRADRVRAGAYYFCSCAILVGYTQKMSKKSEAKKAALAAAQKAAVLPMLLGLTVVLECAWTEQGTGEYPALNLDTEQQERVNKKWKQIVKWRDAVCDQQEYVRQTIRRNAFHREMEAKFDRMERCITKQNGEQRALYNVALTVETIVVSSLLIDWFEEHGRISTNQFLWFIQALNTFASWTCPANDPVVLLANRVYFEMRDIFLEKPDWTKMYVYEPLSETTLWVLKNRKEKFSQAASAIANKYYGGQDGNKAGNP